MIKINNNSDDIENSTDNLNNDDETTKSSVTFTVNQEIEVTPTGFKEYGVFCDCGNGYTGLVHISRITPKFVKNVADYFTIGQPFTAKIIEVHEKTKKLSLSTKEFDLEVKKG